MRRVLIFAAKAIASASLLYFSFARVDLDVVFGRLSRIDPQWLVAALVLFGGATVMGALRWRLVALSCKPDGAASFATKRAIRYGLVGTFFNQTLPSTVGGDAMRIWLLARDRFGWAAATYSVLIDRFAGLLSLALFVLVGLPWSLDLISNPTGRITLLLTGLGSMGACLTFLAFGLLPSAAIKRLWMGHHLQTAARVARRLLTVPATVLPVAAFSFAIHLGTVTTAWCLAKAVAAPLEWTQALFVVLPVILITTIPISIAGWGLRETAMIVAFGYVGLPAGDGLVISVLIGLIAFSVGIVGGILWLLPAMPMSDDAQPAENRP